MPNNAVCSICTDSYDNDKSIAAMPCGHTFHLECLERWLTNTRNCPSCRKPLRKNQTFIQKLFFDFDPNCSQRSHGNSLMCNDELEQSNRKLRTQVTALQSAISKLKNECNQLQSEKTALSCALSDKDTEIQNMNKIQDRLKKKIKDYSTKQAEMDKITSQLDHLQCVQTIVDGVESEVKRVLEEQAGYTPQQLTYIVLLRQQLDNAKKFSEKLKTKLYDCKEKNSTLQRKNSSLETEFEMLQLEVKRIESKNVSLKKKYDKLVMSINSPRGVASSLAHRMVSQSPAPQTVTPPVIRSNGDNTTSNKEPVVLLSPLASTDDSVLACNTSDEDENGGVKRTLDFLEEGFIDDQSHQKKPKLIASKQLLTQQAHNTGTEHLASSTGNTTIKPMLLGRLKIKMTPLNPTITSSRQVKDVTNVQSLCNRKTGTSQSKFFRNGFDGMGGQAQMFNRMESAVQFNVFKKPAKKSKGGSSQSSINDYIVID